MNYLYKAMVGSFILIVSTAFVLLLTISTLVYYGIRRNKLSRSKQQLLLEEKEWLLKEIHHRVKNNLQTNISLLNMQSSYLSSTDAVDALRNTRQRMYAMSLVHQKLYQSDHLYLIDMRDYIEELTKYLIEIFNVPSDLQIQLELDEIKLNLATAIPVALIINEAVTNSIKYAFPDKKNGHIEVGFLNYAGDQFVLTVTDDGIGLPDSIEYEPSLTLGLNLIIGLAHQLQGEVEMKRTPGMSLVIKFKKPNII